MATRRRDLKRQFTVAYDLCSDLRFADLLSLLDALAAAHEEYLAGCQLCRSDVVRADGDYAHRSSWWNRQRRWNALSDAHCLASSYFLAGSYGRTILLRQQSLNPIELRDAAHRK